MPKLTRSVEDLTTVPESYRDLYVKNESGDGYVIDVEGVEDTTALKDALKKERENAKLAKQYQKLFPDKTPDEIAELVKAAEKAANKKDGDDDEGSGKGRMDKEEIDRLLKKREETVRAEYEPKLKEGEDAKTELRNMRLDSVIRTAAIKGKVLEESLDDAIQLARKHFDLRDGKVIVLDDDGDPSGMSPEKFMATTFKERKPYLFQGSGASGSGASRGTRSVPTDPGKMSSRDKIAAGLAQRGQ